MSTSTMVSIITRAYQVITMIRESSSCYASHPKFPYFIIIIFGRDTKVQSFPRLREQQS
jgi:hypothetical protein